MKRRNSALHCALGLALLFLVACTSLPTAPRRVTVHVDQENRTVETEAQIVRDLLQELGVTLENLDRVTPPETAELTDGLTITVTRVQQSTETLTETVPFGRQVVRDASIPEGESRLLEAGRTGILERVYRITEEDGEVIDRTLVRESVTQPPRDEVLMVGTRPQVRTVAIDGTLVYLHNQDAWVIRGSNRSRRRLTALGDLDSLIFSLSPDGTELLFTRTVTGTEHINDLWMVHTTQADPTPIPLNLSDLLWAGWSPDGERIAWTTAELVERPPGWRGQNDLWIATLTENSTLNSRRQILEPEAGGGGGYGWWGTRYAWAPEGETLAYSRANEIGVVDLSRRERTPLLIFPPYRTYSSWAWNPTVEWAPAGDFLATGVHHSTPGIEPEESPIFDLWIVEASGAYSVPLAAEVGMWTTPRFSPSGETLLFGRAEVPYRSEDSDYTLCLIDRDGSNKHCLLTGEDTSISLPVWHWSPDGEQILFIQRGDLFLLPLRDEGVIPITDEGGITALDWKQSS